MTKEDLKKDINKTIDDIASKINEMETKKDNVEENMKHKYNETLQNLKDKKNDLQT